MYIYFWIRSGSPRYKTYSTSIVLLYHCSCRCLLSVAGCPHWRLSTYHSNILSPSPTNSTLQAKSKESLSLQQLIFFVDYRWTWIWRTQWDQKNWSVICKICRIHMTNTWYASDWDQAYRPSYAKIRRTVVRHIQVHLYKHIMLMLISPRKVSSEGS